MVAVRRNLGHLPVRGLEDPNDPVERMGGIVVGTVRQEERERADGRARVIHQFQRRLGVVLHRVGGADLEREPHQTHREEAGAPRRRADGEASVQELDPLGGLGGRDEWRRRRRRAHLWVRAAPRVMVGIARGRGPARWERRGFGWEEVLRRHDRDQQTEHEHEEIARQCRTLLHAARASRVRHRCQRSSAPDRQAVREILGERGDGADLLRGALDVVGARTNSTRSRPSYITNESRGSPSRGCPTEPTLTRTFSP